MLNAQKRRRISDEVDDLMDNGVSINPLCEQMYGGNQHGGVAAAEPSPGASAAQSVASAAAHSSALPEGTPPPSCPPSPAHSESAVAAAPPDPTEPTALAGATLPPLGQGRASRQRPTDQSSAGGVLRKGEAVYYDGNDGCFLPAKVTAVHNDDGAPYYTVAVAGREKSTERSRLRSAQEAAVLELPPLVGGTASGPSEPEAQPDKAAKAAKRTAGVAAKAKEARVATTRRAAASATAAAIAAAAATVAATATTTATATAAATTTANADADADAASATVATAANAAEPSLPPLVRLALNVRPDGTVALKLSNDAVLTATWKEYRPRPSKDGASARDDLVEVTGTRPELMQRLRKVEADWKPHYWGKEWTSRVRDKVNSCFPATEMSISTDFSAVYDHKAAAMRTCEQPHHSNMDVFVVTHSPRYETGEDGKQVRRVTTDIVRVISECSTGSLFHNEALNLIVKNYKSIVPGLERVHVFTDGCRDQYKGRRNFYKMTQFPSELGGIELVHRFAQVLPDLPFTLHPSHAQ